MSKETRVIQAFSHFLSEYETLSSSRRRSMVRTHGQSGFCGNEMIGTKKSEMQ